MGFGKFPFDQNSRLLGTNKQVQEQIVEDQDEQLDDLARVTHRLGEAAQAINVELYVGLLRVSHLINLWVESGPAADAERAG